MAATDRNAPSSPGRAWTRLAKRLVAGAGAAAMICGAAAASAQAQGPSQGTPSIDALHSALHLSPGQDSAWRAYRAVAAAPSKVQDRRGAASQMFPNLTAPQRMDLVDAEMRQELVDLQRQSQALKAFYANLSPQQRAVFDAQTLPRQDSGQQPEQ